MNLPKTAGPWSRTDPPRRVDAAGIFTYMDGAGELYVGYRFDHLDAYEYKSTARDPILLELYWMQTPDDAFGLLSNDWGGEAVSLQPGEDAGQKNVPQSRALYGAGLLRFWSGNLYGRVLAERETPESREQVIALARAIVAGRERSPRPALLEVLPQQVDGYTIRPDRTSFLRSHLVLNSVYFLSSQNILDLSETSEAVVAQYDPPATRAKAARGQPPAGRPHVVVVRYTDPPAARRALDHFLTAYLPETRRPKGNDQRALTGVDCVEHGCVAYRLDERTVAVALDAPNERAARAFVDAVGR